MAFSSTIQPVTKHTSELPSGMDVTTASLLLAVLVSAYAAKNSKKALKKAKRKFMLSALKMKMKNMVRRDSNSTNVIIWVLLAVAIIALLIVAPIAALVLAIIGLILYLTGTIHF